MEKHAESDATEIELAPDCSKKTDPARKEKQWDDCMCGQVCEMMKKYNESTHKKEKLDKSPSEPDSDDFESYQKSITDFETEFAAAVEKHSKPPPGNMDHDDIKSKFYNPPPPAPPDCQHAKWKKDGCPKAPRRSGGPGAMNPDHMHPASLNGPLTSSNLIWADADVNVAVGGSMKKIKTTPTKLKAHESCKCT